MSDAASVRLERRGSIALVTLERPERMNALSQGLVARFGEIGRAHPRMILGQSEQGPARLEARFDVALGRASVAVETDSWQTAGVNSRAELAHLELDWQRRRREEALEQGATLIDPESVWFSADTALGRDCTIEPHVVFGPGVKIADGATIRAFCHIEGASIASGCEVGPFARLRPGTMLAGGARVGNFVEIKKAAIGAGAKVNHLSYIGDATVGAKANIGAGTITCNYDGFAKYETTIGEGAFIGSNSALVAPVAIGAGAIVGAGSVVTRDVAADELAITRAEQKGIAGWAKRFRAKAAARKEGVK